MNASLTVGEILIEVQLEEISKLKKGSHLEDKIWICATGEEFPMELYVTDGSYWKADTLPEYPSQEIKSYEIGFPPECLKPLEEMKTIHADFLSPGVVRFRKVRIRRYDTF